MASNQASPPPPLSSARVPVFPTGEPYLLAPGPLPITRKTRMGRAMLIPLSAPANTDFTIEHNLGRVVKSAQVVANGGTTNQDYPVRLKLTATLSTVNKQSFMADGAIVGGFISVW